MLEYLKRRVELLEELVWLMVRSRGGGGGGGVTTVTATAPIVSSGGAAPDISIQNSGVTAGSYTNSNITVDVKGRVTAATNGAAGGVTSVTGTSPIQSSGGAAPAISITPATDAAAGSMSAADKTKLDGISPGAAVQSVSVVAPIGIGGTAANPIISHDASGVAGPGPYTNATITVDAEGHVTNAASGTTPVTGVAVTAPITNSGSSTAPNIGLADTAVAPGSYTNASLTVDQKGRLTAASSGTAPVTTVNVAAPITSTGGTTPTIGHATSGVSPGSVTNASLTVDADGHVTAASSGTAPVTTVNVAAPITSTGGTTPTIGHATSGVTAGSYTGANITIDADGHVTAAANGPGGTVTSVTGTAPIASSGGSTPAISLNDTAVTPGSYTNASLTVDQKGRLTAAASGAAPVTSVTGTAPIASSGGATPAISLNDTAVTPGSYTNASLTVDQKGRLTAASSGTAPVTSVGVTAPIQNTGTALAPVIAISPMTADLAAGDHNLTGLKNATFTSVPATSGTGAQTIDFSAAQNRKFTFGAGNATFTFTAPAGVCTIKLQVVQDNVGGRTATWPGTVKWVGGVAPVLSTAANAVDWVSFFWDGTNYWGSYGLGFA